MRYAWGVLAFLTLGITLLASCRAPDCASLVAGPERDGCLHKQASAAARSGKLDLAYASVRSIEAPVARAAAIDAVVATAPEKVDGASVLSLCETLPQPFYDSCWTMWNRPHLWNDPSSRNK